MLAISADEMAAIRAEAASAACDLPCVIKRLTRTPTPQGGGSPTWNTISPTGLLAGMAEPAPGQLTNYNYIIGSLAAWRIQFSYGTDVQHGDKLFIAGQELDVQVDLSPQSYNALTTVLATEVK